jgi:hypothetical protein
MKLAKMLQEELDEYRKSNPDFPVRLDFPRYGTALRIIGFFLRSMVKC